MCQKNPKKKRTEHEPELFVDNEMREKKTKKPIIRC